MATVRVGIESSCGVDDLQRQMAFWTAALDYVPSRGSRCRLRRVASTRGSGSQSDLGPASCVSAPVPPRIHLDLYTDDQPGEVKRLLALSADRGPLEQRTPTADFVILADPEGNRFCVVHKPGLAGRSCCVGRCGAPLLSSLRHHLFLPMWRVYM